MGTALGARVINFKDVKSRYLVAAVSFFVAVIAAYFSPLSASALTGAGTSGSPYQIASCADFKDIDDDLDAYYVLTQNINCTSDGSSIMVGRALPFTGNFNGQNHTVTISIIDSGLRNVGLFSQLENATVRNFTVSATMNLTEADGTAGESVGAAVGTAVTSTIEDITSTSTISADLTVGGVVGTATRSTLSDLSMVGSVTSLRANGGGIVGQSSGSAISDSTSSGDVYANSATAGGIAGFAVPDGGQNTSFTRVSSSAEVGSDGPRAGGIVGWGFSGTTIADSYATGDVYGGDNVGGLAGAFNGPSITESYATGDVDGSDSVGGLVGQTNGTTISRSFATGNAVGGLYIGGFIGQTSNNTTIDNSYARGNASGGQYIGGFSGLHGSAFITNSYATGTASGTSDVGGFNGITGEALIANSFWDTQTSDEPTSSGATGKTTAEMKNPATYTDLNSAGLEDSEYAGPWDFTGTENDDANDSDFWILGVSNDGYPCLSWYEGCAENDNGGGDNGGNNGGNNGGEEEATDTDTDGVSDAVENAGPNGGDANGDGIQDTLQDNVVSFVNSVSSTYIALQLDDECTISEAATKNESLNNVQDGGYSYAQGFLNFAASCGDPGYTSSVSVFYYGTSKDGLAVRKYFPASGSYMTVQGAVLENRTIGGRTAAVATYQVTDGGLLDTDGVVNGQIVDPVGLGALSVGTPNTGLGGKKLTLPLGL